VGAALQPLRALRLRTPRLELRLPTATEIRGLADLARAGIHPADRMPFTVAWTDGATSPTFADDVHAYHQGLRDNWSPEDWTLECAVWADDTLVGAQALHATGFGARRAVSSGSWLGQRFQGNGYGTEMRAAILHLAFAGLGAETAESGAMVDNAASARVSEKLGYVPAGERDVAPRGTPVRERIFRLDRAAWEASERPPVALRGLDACLPLFGAAT
jgi:RimJ/RimL family protein N-acetyltransferase